MLRSSGKDDKAKAADVAIMMGAKRSVRADMTANAIAEVRASGAGPKNSNAGVSTGDIISYVVENNIAANAWYPLILLALLTSAGMTVFGFIWWFQVSESGDEELYGQTIADSIYMALQLIATGGFEDSIPDKVGLRWIFIVIIIFGFVIFATFVGFITDAFASFMSDLASGKTKVAASDHTLILGWNEATLRAVVQTSFLRRQYQMLNESRWTVLYYFSFLVPVFGALGLLERPSTSLAVADIVIMDDSITKEEMHIRLEQTLAERGINPARTKLGKNIICRVGDPTNVNDLIRVGAHRASAILVMMTVKDTEEEDESDGKIFNGATLRTCLALRNVLFTNKYSEAHDINPDLRIVMQMLHPSEYVDAALFKHPNGQNVVIPMDLSVFLNSLMFKCAAQPGLSEVILSILNFEGSAIRRRKAKNLRSGPNNAYGDCIGKTFKDMRTQFSKAVFIGIVRPGMPVDKMGRRGFGLCPDPMTIIEPDDLLIFIGPKSSPVHSFEMKGTFAGYVAEAEKIAEANPDIEANRIEFGLTNSKILANTLVCGWRPVWLERPERLFARISEIVSQRKSGSMITFLNAVDVADFARMVLAMGMKPLADTQWGAKQYEMKKEGIIVRHVCGDAADAAVMKPVIMNDTVHTAIVLGTQANVRLAGHHRDTRVLNIMLLLRKLWGIKAEGIPMHVVSENDQDMTARLALAPKRFGPVRTEPDFVNSQAISARALVQALAFPIIQPAIKDLFVESDDSANINVINCSEYVPLGQKMKYGVIRASVLRAKGERSICIGVMWGSGRISVLPPHDEVMTLGKNDRLVVLRRLLLPTMTPDEAASVIARQWRIRNSKRRRR
jgi:hypothetical protein